MSSGLDINFIRESYRSKSDQELLYIVSQDAKGLTPEAVQVVKEELARRNLDAKFANLVTAQNKQYTQQEVDELCGILEGLRCPHCGKKDEPLTAFMTYQTMSFLLFTQYSKKLNIGCAACVRSKTNIATGITLLIGWWGFPWGPIRTIEAFVKNANVFKAVQQHPNNHLRSVVMWHVGLFTRYRDDRAKIAMMVNNISADKPVTAGLDQLDAWGSPAK